MDRSGLRRALVTGATGAVGPALVERLQAEGLQVRAFSRGRTPPPWREGNVEVVRGDIVDRAAVRAALVGVDRVFHLAALLHQPPGSVGPDAYERVNAEAARVVAEEAERAGVRRLVYFSTISVYGPTAAYEADEQSPPAPQSAYAWSKLRGEQAVRACEDGGGLAVTVLRLAAVYGPRVKGNYLSLARAVESGWFVPVGSGRNRRTLVHERDVAEAAWLASERAQAAGRVYNVSDGCVHQLREVVAAIHEALGRRERPLRVPVPAARALVSLGDAVLRGLRRPPRFGPLLDKYLEDVAVRGERIRHELGFEPRVALAPGWHEVLGSGVLHAWP